MLRRCMDCVFPWSLESENVQRVHFVTVLLPLVAGSWLGTHPSPCLGSKGGKCISCAAFGVLAPLCEAVPGCGSQASLPAAAKPSGSRAEAGEVLVQRQAGTDGWPAPSTAQHVNGEPWKRLRLPELGSLPGPCNRSRVNGTGEEAGTVSCSGYSQCLAAINLGSLTPFWALLYHLVPIQSPPRGLCSTSSGREGPE